MIVHCDSEVLNNDVVMDFLQKGDMCNVPENTAKLMAPYSKDWTGPDASKATRELDPAELTREDQIYLQTAYELHHYWKSRMRALALTRSFEVEYEQISTKLKLVVTVSESLRDSVSLMNVLGLILDIGNYMNDSNKQASGFKLSSLARLGMVKDEKNESTFADLVERIVRTQYPEWEGFTDDIAGVISAQKLNVEALQLDSKRYIENIKNVQSSIDSGNLSDPKKFHPQDRVSQVVQRSMKDARRKAEQLQLYLDDMVRTYDDIMVFYGEDPSDENARRDFFGKLALFLKEWHKSREKNVVSEETRKRNEASMKRKHAQLKSSTSDGSAPLSPSSAGAMDTLLKQLRAAAPAAKDQRDRRRRARLANRHQVRVASGQKIPEPDELADSDPGLKSPDSIATESVMSGILSPDAILSPTKEIDEGDVAERAAAILQEIGGDDTPEDPEASSRRDSARRLRRNPEEERKARRRRRTEKGTSIAESNLDHEDREMDDKDVLAEAEDDSEKTRVDTPVTVVQPPSPRGSESKPIELDD